MEETLVRLRGRRRPFFLVAGETELLDPGGYPFERDRLPIFCRPLDGDLEPRSAHMSGSRSLVLPHGGGWFKAKAVGVPTGASRPVLRGGSVLTYHMTHAMVGSGDIIWGFLSVEEAENELSWMKRAGELSLPSITPIGIGVYKGVRVMELRNRPALLEYLRTRGEEGILRDFDERSRETEAACIFTRARTDVRADELLYAFLFPRIWKILDFKESVAYLRWMSSSCGYNLRLHHDQGLLHGTIPRPPIVMTNSHMANHLVDDEKTWVADYHMAGESEDETLRRAELLCLCHVMVPLREAKRIAASELRDSTTQLVGPAISQLRGEPTQPTDWLHVLSAEDPSFILFKGKREKLTEALVHGVIHGYEKGEVLEVESELKRRMLRALTLVRKRLWEIHNMPEGLQRGAVHIQRILSQRKASKGRIEEAIRTLKEQI